MAKRARTVLSIGNNKKVTSMRVSLITCLLGACLLVGQPPAPVAALDEQTRLKAMEFMLQRAELVRFLAAEHIAYLGNSDDMRTKQLLDNAAQVLAYNIVCNDDALDPATLNLIAAESTLQIALKIDSSPINKQISDVMGQLTGPDRMMLVADVSSAVLLFKVGRRRGLFDALLTDFGTDRFCKGMGANMRGRYHALAAQFETPAQPAAEDQPDEWQ